MPNRRAVIMAVLVEGLSHAEAVALTISEFVVQVAALPQPGLSLNETTSYSTLRRGMPWSGACRARAGAIPRPRSCSSARALREATSGFTSIEPLKEDHLLDAFDSGEPELDEWLVQRGWRNQLAGFSRYVTTEEDRVVGYHAVCAFALLRSDATGRARRRAPSQFQRSFSAGSVIDRDAQGRGPGAGLLRHAMELTVAASDTIGVRMLVVADAAPDCRLSRSSRDFSRSAS